MIGLTGPIGCGKSTIAGMLLDLGAIVIDADALAREATGPGAPTLPRIRERFGGDVFEPDGTLDRAAVAAVVFEDTAALRDLEAIVHPDVRRRVEDALAAAAGSAAMLVVVEAIKLIEGGLAARCDEVWLVECDPQTQRERLAARGMTVADVERRLATQGPDLGERLASHATRRLSTDGELDATRERVEDALADALAPLLLEEGRP